jgi:hypothetical protein
MIGMFETDNSGRPRAESIRKQENNVRTMEKVLGRTPGPWQHAHVVD